MRHFLAVPVVLIEIDHVAINAKTSDGLEFFLHGTRCLSYESHASRDRVLTNVALALSSVKIWGDS